MIKKATNIANKNRINKLYLELIFFKVLYLTFETIKKAIRITNNEKRIIYILPAGITLKMRTTEEIDMALKGIGNPTKILGEYAPASFKTLNLASRIIPALKKTKLITFPICEYSTGKPQ